MLVEYGEHKPIWVVSDVVLVLFVVELEAATGLAHVLFIAYFARKRVDATSVIECSGRVFGEGLKRCEIVLLHLKAILMLVCLKM